MPTRQWASRVASTAHPPDWLARPPSNSWTRSSGMRERALGTGLLAATLGICCGLPVLATLGALGFLTGLSTTNWVLIGLGAVATVIGGWTVLGRRRRSGVESPGRQAERSHWRVAGASEEPTLPKEQ